MFLYKSYPSILFEIAAFVKYCFLPLLLYSDSTYYEVMGPSPSDYGIQMAIKITIYEMLLIYAFRYIYISKSINIYDRSIDYWQEKIFKHTKQIVLVALSIGLIFLILFPNIVFPGLIFLEDKNDVASREKVPIFPILISIWKIFTFLLSLCVIYKSYLKRKDSNKSLFLSVLAYIICLFLILGDSRWGVIFLTFSFLAIITKLYGKVARRYVYIISPIFLILLIFITIYKFNDQMELLYDGDIIKLFGQLFASQLQAYFSGISLVAQSVDMSIDIHYLSDFSIKTLWNDFVGSIPLVSKLSDQTMRTNYLFNQYVLGANTEWFTQIIPCSGIGYIYMGFWLSPFFTVIYNILGLHYERKMYFTSSIFLKYIYIMIAFWMSLSICFNTQIPFGNVMVFQMPLYIIYYVITHLKYR